MNFKHVQIKFYEELYVELWPELMRMFCQSNVWNHEFKVLQVSPFKNMSEMADNPVYWSRYFTNLLLECCNFLKRLFLKDCVHSFGAISPSDNFRQVLQTPFPETYVWCANLPALGVYGRIENKIMHGRSL